MRKKPSVKSRGFNLRLLLAGALCATAALLGTLSLRAGPARPKSDPDGNWSIVHSPDMAAQGLTGIACVSESDCWAVGSHSKEDGVAEILIEHWDGNSWTTVPAGSVNATDSHSLSDVTCISASDCWAVGSIANAETFASYPVIEHWNGNTWSIISSPTPSGSSRLNGIACTSTADCWAVGIYPGGTLVEHWDGNAWSIVASPNAGTNSRLQKVTCTSAANCWSVGYYSVGSVRRTLIERWNGTSWTIVTSPNTGPAENNFLYGIACTSDLDCWATGYSYDPNADVISDVTLVEHWNGVSWAIVNSPNAAVGRSQLYGVTCVSSSDCWAVGWAYDVDFVITYRSLIEHWDGVSWSVVPAPETSAANNSDYLGRVACASGLRCFAVGDVDFDTSLIVEWNGTSWSAVLATSLDGGGLDNQLLATTCLSASDCWAVGYYNTADFGHPGQTLVEHWDGNIWSVMPSPNTEGEGNFLHGVTCTSATDCWAVGESYHGESDITLTLIQHWDGTAWSIVTSPNVSGYAYHSLMDVTCASSSDCWAIGFYDISNSNVLIEHWDGISWSLVTSPATGPGTSLLNSVTCSSGTNCWAVGVNGGQTLVERWDGLGWSISSSPNGNPTGYNVLTGVTCNSASDCWAVGRYEIASGNHTLVEHWDGVSWSIVASPDSPTPSDDNSFNSVACISPTDCWAVGKYFAYFTEDFAPSYVTFMEHWDGSAWEVIPSPTVDPAFSSTLQDVTCPSASRCWAVGSYRNNYSGIYQTLTHEFTPIPPLTSIVSNKSHGDAGVFGIDLPLDESGIECRTGGATGDYSIVFNFANTLTGVGGASVTAGTGSVSGGNIDNDTQKYVVNLTGVTNIQRVVITLNDVRDAAGNIGNTISGTMNLLIGDTNADGSVNSADIGQTKSRSGQTVSAANFRQDVNADGLLNSADISLVKSKSGTALPQLVPDRPQIVERK